jgi:magnesium-transporting ATPase (P-type)
MDWHKALLLFLWITPHLLLVVVAAVVCKRRLYREFPYFFAYVLCRIAVFILLFALYTVYGVAGRQYTYVFSATLLLIIALGFGVIDEVSKDLFSKSPFLKVAARRLLRGVAGLLLAMGVLLAVYAPGNNSVQWHAGISVINRGAAVVQCGLLLALLLLSRFLGLTWRRLAFGITLGLGILASVDVAASALRAEFTSNAARELLNLLTTGTYLVCVSIWMGYLLAPELEPAASPTIGAPDEVETWNTELHNLLRG